MRVLNVTLNPLAMPCSLLLSLLSEATCIHCKNVAVCTLKKMQSTLQLFFPGFVVVVVVVVV